MPQSSVNKIHILLEKIEKDLLNPEVFNRENAIEYIRNLTEAAYNLESSELDPDSPSEQAQFAENRKIWMEKLFRIQLQLRDKMHEFNLQAPLSEEQIAGFRNGNMYLSYAQDFILMEWSLTQDLIPPSKLFAAHFPITLKNSNLQYFELMPGDIILVRGSSFVSATIARSGDYLSNYSHVAMVIQDPRGNISVAEALLEEGIIVYSIEKYLNLERLSRAAVIRPQNNHDAQAAARAGFKIVDEDLKASKRKMFDLLMNPKSTDKTYCFKLLISAFSIGTNDKIHLPAFPMTFKKALAGNSFYRGLGNKLEVGAAPDDIFFQPEFDILMVQRDVSMLKKDWAFDVTMSAIFEFIDKKYEYKKRLPIFLLAHLLFFLKNDLNISIKQVPSGVSQKALQLILLHKNLSHQLQSQLMKLMTARLRPLAYKELEAHAKVFLEKNKEKFFSPLNKMI